MLFWVKNTLKNNHNHTPKHNQKLVDVTLLPHADLSTMLDYNK